MPADQEADQTPALRQPLDLLLGESGLSSGSDRLVRRRVLVSGRVQGVWFRQTCRDRAATVGVAGWVRNLTDGRVEVAIEGPPAAVDALVAWCHEGPPRASVTGVEVLEEAPEEMRGFRVS